MRIVLQIQTLKVEKAFCAGFFFHPHIRVRYRPFPRIREIIRLSIIKPLLLWGYTYTYAYRTLVFFPSLSYVLVPYLIISGALTRFLNNRDLRC